jgi:hypothetical protein
MSFFKNEDGNLLEGPNFVLSATFELRADIPEDRERIEDGWKWFDTEEEARLEYDLPAPELPEVP